MRAQNYLYYYIVSGLAILFLIFFSDYIAWEIGLKVANVTYGEKILASIYVLTALMVFWYAWETRRMKNEMVTQTELTLKPILVLFVRKCSDKNEYRIQASSNNSNFALKVRNVGRGPAANLLVKSDAFIVEKYRNNTLASEPKGDEQSVKIKRRDGSAVQRYSELNGAEFELSAQNFAEPSNRYFYVYRIVNLERQEVKFVR